MNAWRREILTPAMIFDDVNNTLIKLRLSFLMLIEEI